MTEMRPPFRLIPLAEYHERRADLANRVYEDELENDLIAEAYAVTPESQELQKAIGFNVYIDSLQRDRAHDMGRAGFRLVVYGNSTSGLGVTSHESFAITHQEDPARERSPLAWEIVGRPINLARVGRLKYGFLLHAAQDDAIAQFTARSWQTPDDLTRL